MLEAALVTRLAEVAPNMYPIDAPKDYTTPCVIYRRLHTNPVRDISTSTVSGYWIALEIDVYDPDYLTARALAKDIELSLSSWDDADANSCSITNDIDDIDTKTEVTLYRVFMTFLLFAPA
jgi:hypothetical protein